MDFSLIPDEIEIFGACFGLHNVTEKVKHEIKTNKKVLASINVFGDSWFGVKKTLIVVYGRTWSDAVVSIVEENQEFIPELPNVESIRAENSNFFSGILGAAYGKNDVTLKARQIEKDNSGKPAILLKANNETFGDGWVGMKKSLVIVCMDSSTSAFSVHILDEGNEIFLPLTSPLGNLDIEKSFATTSTIETTETPILTEGMEEIKHVVVLMMENRSFDSMLSNLYSETNKPSQMAGNSSKADFVNFKNFKQSVLLPDNKIHEYPFIENNSNTQAPDGGPGEPHWPHTTAQIYCSPPSQGGNYQQLKNQFATPPSGSYNYEKDPTMQGFLQDFMFLMDKQIQSIPEEKKAEATEKMIQSYMSVFAAEKTPVSHTLATKYAVCEEWFASVPTQTWPNRLFHHYGWSWEIFQNLSESASEAADLALTAFRLYITPKSTFFERTAHLNKSFTTKVYRHSFPLSEVFGLNSSTKVVQFSELAKDSASNQLPSFSFIEPRYEPLLDSDPKTAPTSHNDHHPWHNAKTFPWRPSILEGEKLILSTYEALFGKDAKDPESTLLIVTYDEAGGCYDHVPPPTAPHPGFHNGVSWDKIPTNFAWKRLGIRVPAIFISPRIAEKTILRRQNATDQSFDHTSVSRSIRSRWQNSEELSGRERNAPTFWHVLNGSNIRPKQEALDIINSLNNQLLDLDRKEIPKSGVWSSEDLENLNNEPLPELADGILKVQLIKDYCTSIAAAHCLSLNEISSEFPRVDHLAQAKTAFEIFMNGKQHITVGMRQSLNIESEQRKSYSELVNSKISQLKSHRAQFLANKTVENAHKLAETRVPDEHIVKDLSNFSGNDPILAVTLLSKFPPVPQVSVAISSFSEKIDPSTLKSLSLFNYNNNFNNNNNKNNNKTTTNTSNKRERSDDNNEDRSGKKQKKK